MSILSSRQQVRQETRNTHGEYTPYDAAPSNAALSMEDTFDKGVESIAERHGVEVQDSEANPVRVHGRTQDIRAMAIDMEREHGVSTEVRGINRGGPGVEKEGYPLDDHVDNGQEVEADIHHQPLTDTEDDRDPIDAIIDEASVEGTLLYPEQMAGETWESSGSNLPRFTTAEAQQRLTEDRNAGILLRNSDGSYTADLAMRPPVEGEVITPDEALRELRRGTDHNAAELKSGHRVVVGEWSDDGDELPEPKYREMVVDEEPDGCLKVVDDDPTGTFATHEIPLTARETQTGVAPRITGADDGTITVEVDEEVDGVDVIPGERYTLKTTVLTDDFTSPRPLTNAAGEESPFDVGPTQYAGDPDYPDRVTLTRTVHRPDGTQVGRIYQGDQRQWVVDHGNGSMEDPAFDTAEEASEHLHYTSGGRGEWSKPTAEDVPLFDLDT